MQHPDEGTVHAWIDGALDAESARELEAHVATCEECARVVAEARGLVAASSRILTALDNVPGDVIPAARTTAKPGRVDRLRATPFWMRTAAAVLIVAGASALVFTAKLNKPELKRADIAMSTEADLSQVQPPAEVAANAPAPVAAAPGRDLAAGSTAATSATSVARAPAAPEPFSARGGVASAPARRQAVAPVPTVGTSEAAKEARLADAAEERLARKEVQETKVENADRLSAAAPPTVVSRPDTSARIAGNVAGILSGVQTSAGAGKSSIGRELEGARTVAPKTARSAAPSAAQSAPAPSSVSAEDAFQRSGANGWRMRAATGCYELSMSPWTGGSIPFGAPPVRIELDSLTSVQEAIRGLNLVHPARGAAGNGAPLAYWRVLGDSAYVTWRDDRRGVVLRLPIGGEVLTGSARTFSTSNAEPVHSSAVEARRISCR